jgi:type VI protein secretion system component Hcp
MSKSDLLLESLKRFYEDPVHAAQLHDILTTKSRGISLRNLEWFVTNYAKNKHVTYTTPTGRTFTVHVAYKSSLDGYSKKLFDPFCRTERIQFQGLKTTVAQLNFIKWCLTNGIIEYMIKHMPNGQSHPETLESNIPCKTGTENTA